MTRIGSNAPGNIQPHSWAEPSRGEDLSLFHLPEELPPASHTKLSMCDITQLLVPDGTDLAKLSKNRALLEVFDRLWAEVTLEAIVEGGKHSKSSSPPLTPPMEPLG